MDIEDEEKFRNEHFVIQSASHKSGNKKVIKSTIWSRFQLNQVRSSHFIKVTSEERL